MRRSLVRDMAILGVLCGLWLACFALFTIDGLRGGPVRTHLVVTPPTSPDAYPVVERLRPDLSAPAGLVRAGDTLLRVGDVDLRGAMPWSVYAHLYSAMGDAHRVEVTYERAGRRATSSERVPPIGAFWREALVSLVFAFTALLVVLRAPESRLARSWLVATLVWTLSLLVFHGTAEGQTYFYLGVRAVTGCLWAPLMVQVAYRFPEGAWPRDLRTPLWPWLFAVLGLTWTSKWMGVPCSIEVGTRANPAIGSLVIAAILVIATRNYARAGALGRRQVRWVMLGTYVGMAPVLVGNFASMLRPELAEVATASQASLIAIPISVLIAVTRSNLLDIDRLISGTASYTILLVILGAGALTLVPWMAEEAFVRAGVDPTLVQVAAGAILALCLVRLEPLLRPRLERAFFAERQALQDGIDRLVGELSGAPDATALARLVGERLDELLKPSSCVIYARGDDAYAPVFSRGSAVTPYFELESPLLAALAERTSAVDLERGRALDERASQADRAALGSLAAAVLLPVSRQGELAAFVVLGRKGSGDIYTPTDLALLGVVGASAAAFVERLGADQLLAESRTLQDKLRQYVPASVAAQLAQGRDLEAGERDVSVLFADLRGYTALAEGRRAEEIFSAVSRYTETVTRVVTGHGGTVVEFNGDGMMAVFGAPEALPDKERCAVESAREIVAEVQSLPGLSAGGDRLDVGVGVATGPAYVGAIRSVDRYIWSAIGNTTNLAARLQSLTKDFDSPIVIDEATRSGADRAAAGFERQPEISIRGLRERRDLFSLPRERLAAA